MTNCLLCLLFFGSNYPNIQRKASFGYSTIANWWHWIYFCSWAWCHRQVLLNRHSCPFGSQTTWTHTTPSPHLQQACRNNYIHVPCNVFMFTPRPLKLHRLLINFFDTEFPTISYVSLTNIRDAVQSQIHDRNEFPSICEQYGQLIMPSSPDLRSALHEEFVNLCMRLV